MPNPVAQRASIAEIFDIQDTPCVSLSRLELDDTYRNMYFAHQLGLKPAETALLFYLTTQLRNMLRDSPSTTMEECFGVFRHLMMTSTKTNQNTYTNTNAVNEGNGAFSTTEAKAVTDYITQGFFRHFALYKGVLDGSLVQTKKQHEVPLCLHTVVASVQPLSSAVATSDQDLDIQKMKFDFDAQYERNSLMHLSPATRTELNPDLFHILQAHVQAAQEQSELVLQQCQQEYDNKINELDDARFLAEQNVVTKGSKRPTSSNKK